ncbi:MAG: adenosine deaminase, partial [Pseudobdellovibrio sp.]|nr:adenosine deaminase [Pseudobdellovibrio sp.]
WSTLLEIATTLKIEIPKNSAQQRSHFLVTEPMKDLNAVLSKFLIAQKVLASEEILERLAFEACEDAFNDGIRICEMRYAPTFIADGHTSLTYEKIHQAFVRGLNRAKKQMPIATGLICILQRILPLEKVSSVTDFAIENKDTFLALDLADNEMGSEPRKFAKDFERAKKAGLHITVHSGETPDKEAGQWIKDSIQILGAERIGHGIQAINHKDVMQLLIEKDIPLEVCPYSNYLTQAFASYETHPLRKLYDAGVPVTLNSDDPGMFASLLTDDYVIAQEYQGFGIKEFTRCNEIAFNKSFIPLAEKTAAFKG